MDSISMLKHIWPGSKSQPSPALEPKQERSYEKLKSLGYGALGVLASLVILAVSIALTFIGAGFILARLSPGGGWENFVSWYGNTFGASIIVGPILSIYPIIKIAGPIFAQAKVHWNR